MKTLLNKLDKRQKILISLLAVVVLVLIWQVYGLFANDKSVITGEVAKGDRPVAPTINNRLLLNNQTVRGNQPIAPTAGAATAVDPATNSQAEYLRLVNEYQMAQLQRMIAEDNEAIAVAKRNAAQAMSDTAKMAGSADSLVASSSDDNNGDQDNSNTYSLVYTGQQNDGQWTATLKKNGQTYDVIPGRQLPDGSQVTSIDENGVLLNQAQNAGKLLVTFSGVTQINNKPVINNVNSLGEQSSLKNTVAQPAKMVAIKPVAPKPIVSLVATVVKKPAAPAPIVVVKKSENNIVPKVVASVVKTVAKTPAPALVKSNTQPVLISTGYTIQLTSDHKLSDAQDFIAAHQLQNKATYFHVKTKQGSEWYVAVYGQYSTRADAQKALNTLPTKVRSEGAYVVSASDIQSMVKRA